MRLNPHIFPKAVFYEPSQQGWANEIRERLKEYENDFDNVNPEFRELRSESDLPRVESLLEGKQRWFLTSQKGHWFKKCPGTSEFVCCTYFVLNLGEGCPFDCTYCYLQGYLNQPLIKLYGNMGDCLEELSQLFVENDKRNHPLKYRIGTGEYMDSLALDPILNVHAQLIRCFKGRPGYTLEIKTKSHHIDHLLDSQLASENVVFSWTLSPDYQHQKYERRTSSVRDRIEAARKALQAGYLVSFNLDPMIVQDGVQENELVEFVRELNVVFEDAAQTIPVFLGTVRVSNPLKDALVSRWSPADIDYLWDELLPQADAKHRYGYARRTKLYRLIKQNLGPVFVPSLCMESADMWQTVFGAHPKKIENQTPFFSMT
jgi:spore photoproduct lyase